MSFSLSNALDTSSQTCFKTLPRTLARWNGRNITSYWDLMQLYAVRTSCGHTYRCINIILLLLIFTHILHVYIETYIFVLCMCICKYVEHFTSPPQIPATCYHLFPESPPDHPNPGLWIGCVHLTAAVHPRYSEEIACKIYSWLVVSTHLKKISQIR